MAAIVHKMQLLCLSTAITVYCEVSLILPTACIFTSRVCARGNVFIVSVYLCLSVCLPVWA